jgi:hypothetical protein
MTQYVTTVALEEYLRSTVVADTSEIDAAALAASTAIDSHCQRTFVVPTVTGAPTPSTPTTRTFVPSGSSLLKVPDIGNITDLVITIDGTATTDYQLEIAPGVRGPIGVDGRTWPYSYIRLLSGSWGNTTEATVSIAAYWGWPVATPPEIPLACRMLVKDYLSSRDTRFGFVQMGDFSRTIAENGVVAGLLAPLRRVESWGVA